MIFFNLDNSPSISFNLYFSYESFLPSVQFIYFSAYLLYQPMCRTYSDIIYNSDNFDCICPYLLKQRLILD